MTHGQQCKLKNAAKALYDGSDRFPTFGSGVDLRLYSTCLHKSDNTYSDLGSTYEAPKEGNIHPRCYLAGSYNFIVTDLEVY